MTRHSALFAGKVRHRRYLPRAHTFDYPLFMVYLDLDDIETVCAKSRYWSSDRRNLVEFRREDYLGAESELPLKAAVQQKILEKTGQAHQGPVHMLTHLRYWGFCFNPVSFYFCYHPNGEHLEHIVAEINNTPWNERYAYVLSSEQSTGSGGLYRFEFDKVFHVSPFMPMDLHYQWQFRLKQQSLAVHMRLYRRAHRIFDATLALRRQALTTRAMHIMPLKYPFLCVNVLWRIYWQALRLWLKRIPVYTHPQKQNMQTHTNL